MIRYIHADVRRIFKKKSFIYTVLGFVALFLVMMFIFHNKYFDELAYLSRTQLFWGFFPLVVGIVIFLSVYHDDFKSKSMQVAIGYGISRNKVVLTKILEVAILSMLSALILAAVCLALPLPMGLSLSGAQSGMIILNAISQAFHIIGYAGIATILVYTMQNSTNGIITYVLLSSKTITIILSTILGQEFIINTVGDLTPYLYSSALSYEVAAMAQEQLDVTMLLVILAYLIFPTLLTMLGYKNKELEF